jgi:phosphatidylserine/phosphatidylglycerophosphate/cardiolipin synthase-like enzyme
MKTNDIARSHYLLFFLILALVLTSCIPSTPIPPTILPITTGTEPRTLPSWLEIYFTNPADPHAADYEGGPDEILAAAIDHARLSVDVAIYSLNLWSIRDALIHAHQRGVVVRMVMESDNMDNKEVQQIQNAGIPIIGDQREGLMHNKFVVIDHTEVWTGSMNYTISSAYRDNNNLLRIHSTDVAEDYTTEFNEMFVDNLFGSDGRAKTLHPNLTIDGTPMEIYFSPDDGVAAHILSLLQGAQESIYFMAYTFTSDDLGKAIRQRAAAGVTVAGVMDDGQIKSSPATEYDRFMQAGLDVRRDGNAGLMHHKVILIDKKIVITGSYNFTVSAETTNDENVVVIHNANVAAQYLEEFQKVYNQAQSGSVQTTPQSIPTNPQSIPTTQVYP